MPKFKIIDYQLLTVVFECFLDGVCAVANKECSISGNSDSAGGYLHLVAF
ncbi:hypothetical protein [Pseudoalteromonas phenolica]|nr:hypothetical protein [Pseudoalteromonas phenolica]